MSTIQQPPQPSPPPPMEPGDDPFRYGWRYRKIVGPDGAEDYEQVPLTPEDLLFPEEGDFVVQTESHRRDWVYLHLVFDLRLSDDPSAVVLADCRVDFNVPGVRPLGPDVVVILGVKRRRDWATLDLAAEGAHAALVVEVASPETRPNDYGIKKDFYHRARVPLYVIVDSQEVDGRREITFRGHRWTPGGYEPLAPDERGRLWLDPVRVWLGTAEAEYGERCACFDEVGREIGEYEDLNRDRLEAQTRAEQAEAFARELQARNAQARERFERARERLEQTQAETEQVRAGYEQTLAETEQVRARLEEALTETEEARVGYEQARERFERAQAETEQVRMGFERARARYERAEAETEQVRARLEQALAETEQVRARFEQAEARLTTEAATAREAFDARLRALEEELRHRGS